MTGDFLVLLATMASLASLVFQVPLVPLVPLALAETSLLKCLTVTMRNPAVVGCLRQAQWVQWVPVVLPDLLVQMVPKVSQALMVSQASPVLLAQWVPVVQQAPQARTAMMVNLANLAVLASVVHQVLRVLVDSPEPLDFQASRDTEVSAV